ncbi:MAG: 3-dehydroquinate dehydratase [Baekduia sp.]|jgi:3-dehydroquinate dehydratase-2|nr:3-dehydroquinate dehydratase [Baekduia sp.]
MTPSRNRVAVVHGVNLDQLGRRPAAHYGGLNFDALERQIGVYADELGMVPRFYQSNDEGEFIGHLHRLGDMVDAILINPGAWTHYAWSIHDALEIAALPAVEVHLSDVMAREEWRRISVIQDLCVATVSGEGVEGYRTALTRLKQELNAP